MKLKNVTIYVSPFAKWIHKKFFKIIKKKIQIKLNNVTIYLIHWLNIFHLTNGIIEILKKKKKTKSNSIVKKLLLIHLPNECFLANRIKKIF